MTPVTLPPPQALALRGLTRRYGSLTAVDDVSLQLPVGARHAVIGTNGAGKTTLLNLIAGTDRADRGRILLGDADITTTAPSRRSRLGIARSFQQPRAVAELTALENIVLALWRHHPQRRSAWRRPHRHRRLADAAHRHLATVGLADVSGRQAGVLSHGQRRMLDIAAALAAGPRLLLLDEPAAGLTDDDIGKLLGILTGLPDDVAVLLVEHHTEVVARLADTVTVLASGRLLLTGTTQEVLQHPQVQEVYLGNARTAHCGTPAALAEERTADRRCSNSTD